MPTSITNKTSKDLEEHLRLENFFEAGKFSKTFFSKK